jgi:hypothetical protein
MILSLLCALAARRSSNRSRQRSLAGASATQPVTPTTANQPAPSPPSSSAATASPSPPSPSPPSANSQNLPCAFCATPGDRCFGSPQAAPEPASTLAIRRPALRPATTGPATIEIDGNRQLLRATPMEELLELIVRVPVLPPYLRSASTR